MDVRDRVDKKFWLALNVFLSGPILLYAFTEPSGCQPKDISVAWWVGLDEKTKFFSLLNGASSLFVNVLGHGLFLQSAVDKLTDKSIYKDNSIHISLIMGFCSAITSAVLAYDAFLWAGSVIKILASLAVFIGTTTSRFVSFYMLISFVSEFRLRRMQRVMAVDLLKLKSFPSQDEEINSVIDDSYIKQLSDVVYSDAYYNEIKSNSIINYFHLYYDLVFCGVFSFLLIPFIFLTFLEKALRGVGLITNNISDKGELFPGMSKLDKLRIGFLPAFSSSIFYVFSILYFTKSLCSYLNAAQTKSQLGMLGLIFILNFFASKSMFNVGRSVVQSANIFSLSDDSLYGSLMPYMDMCAVFMANTNACMSHYNKNITNISPVKFSGRVIKSILFFLEERAVKKSTLREIECNRNRLFHNERHINDVDSECGSDTMVPILEGNVFAT